MADTSSHQFPVPGRSKRRLWSYRSGCRPRSRRRPRAHVSSRGLADALARDLGRAAADRRDSAAAGARRRPGRVSPSARRLVAAAARALPEADRACCAEEFQGRAVRPGAGSDRPGRAAGPRGPAAAVGPEPAGGAAASARRQVAAPEALLRAAVGVVPTIQLARLGLPALIAVAPLAVLVLAAVCWVLADDARAARAAAVLQAWRGSLPPALRPPRRRQPPTDR
jgi:hypothetical protein